MEPVYVILHPAFPIRDIFEIRLESDGSWRCARGLSLSLSCLSAKDLSSAIEVLCILRLQIFHSASMR